MALNRDNLRLFGLDLVSCVEYFQDGWRDALRWRALRWLSPAEPVRVLHADGRSSWVAGDSGAPVRARTVARAIAIELPEDIVLRRELTFPRLPAADLADAVLLEARSASPFAEDDLAVGFVADPGSGRSLRVRLALASRRQIERHVEGLSPQLNGIQPEIRAAGRPPIVFSGYGERNRARRTARARGLLIAGLFAAAALALAIALTPTIQKRQQAIEAQYAYDALLQHTAPQTALREQLVRANEQLALARDAITAQGNPLAVLDGLTRQLPDDVVLNVVELRGAEVRISGQADNPAALMQALGGVPFFRDVRAPSASARAPGSKKESFTIQLSVVPEALPR